MQSGSRVMLDNGRLIALGKLVKSGGAGSVYLLPDDPGRVAKVYHPHVDRADYERKLQAMLRLSPDLPEGMDGDERLVQIAWPSSLARDERGRFVGFLMPKLDIQATIELEYMLQERQARAAGLPTGLGARMTLAANLSAVLAELHRQQHYVVDLKPVNVRFYRRSLNLAMLDCDGFSIRGPSGRFPAQQYTPEYLAPEFHAAGIDLHGEEQQDRFALAVIVFQLLNFGIHPYTGRPETDAVPTDIPGRIAGRWYAYGLQENKRFKPNPGSGHEQMPLELRLLFDRAFAFAGETRPSPSEWAAALKPHALKSTGRLTICARDPAHQHFASFACAACARDTLRQRAGPLPMHAPPSQAPAVARSTVRRPQRNKRRKASVAATPALPPVPSPVAAATYAALPTSVSAMQRQPGSGAWPLWVMLLVMGSMMLVLLLPILIAPGEEHTNIGPMAAARTVAPESARRTDLLLSAASGHRALYERNMGEMKAFSTRIGDRRQIDHSGASEAKQQYREFAFGLESRRRSDYSDAETIMRLLEKTHRLDPTDAGIAFELGFMQLLHFGLRERAYVASQPYSLVAPILLPKVDTVFERAVAAAPEEAAHWYGLGLSYVDRPDSRLAVGAFAISEVLASKSARPDTNRARLLLAERSLGHERRDRLEILKARGLVAAAALGAPTPTMDVQLLGGRELPPLPVQQLVVP